jgi:hypothetical protein
VRWKLHSDEYPSRSAVRAMSLMFAGVAHDPETGMPKPNFIGSP